MGVPAIERGGFEEARSETIRRRVKTIVPRVIGLVLVTVLFPVLLVIALALDLVRWATRRVPWVATRHQGLDGLRLISDVWSGALAALERAEPAAVGQA